MKEYFYKSEYKWLYLSKFFFSFANSFVDIFGVVMLYKNGMPLYMILFIYGLRFGIMGLCSPLFLKVSAKSGIASCAILANLLKIASTYMIQNGAQNNILLFVLVMGIPGGLRNPMEDANSSQYVETEHRGRYNSMQNIFGILGQALASAFVTWGITSDNNTLLLLVISMFFLLDYLCIGVVDYRPKVRNTHVFKQTIQYMFKNMNCCELIYALRTNHIIERLFVPLYVYLVLQDFVTFSMVITVSLLVQIVTIMLIGKLTDKNSRKTNDLVTAIRTLITALYLFIQNKMAIACNKALSDNFEKVYETTLRTSIQNIIKDSDEDSTILSTVGQMSLCFTEVIVFLGLSLISYFVDIKVFYVIFILSIISTLDINLLVRKK